MKIKEKIYQNRRDFKAIFVCENCGAEEVRWGYDDAYFHNEVIPSIVCKKCGKSALDLKVKIKPIATRYPEGMEV